MVLGIGTAISNMMVKGFQSTVFGKPSDYDLKYEAVEFVNSDGVTLRGWLVEPETPTDKILIQSHYGVQCSRSGYTPEGKGFMAPFPRKISFLEAAPEYTKSGYAVLMYDLCNHGESDPGKTEYVSWGPNEAKDVVAAVKFAATDKNYKKIGLLSFCMGGASTVYAFGEGSLQPYASKLKAMVFLQPLTYKQMIVNMGFPAFLESMSTPVTKSRLGFDLSEKSFFPMANKVSVPTFVIQNTQDPFHKPEEVQEFYDSLTVEKDILLLDLEKSRFAGYEWIAQNPKKVLEWFDKFM